MAMLPIETKRLILRDYTPEDWRDVHAYASDDEVVKHMPWGPNTEEQTQEFITRIEAHWNQEPRLTWELGIELKETRRIIGGVGLTLNTSQAYFGAPQPEAELGYVLNREYWRRGIMTEAVRGIMTWGFRKHRVHRIWASCAPENAGSIGVLEKAGLRREGYMKANLWLKGVWRDSILFAITENEFAQR